MVPTNPVTKHLATDDKGQEPLRHSFVEAVRREFAFLADLGFTEVEASSSVVRFSNSKINVDTDICFDSQSYELGIVVSYKVNCSLGQMIRVVEPEVGKDYRNFAATTESGLADGLRRLEELTKRYGQRALRGDPEFFSELEIKRRAWVHDFAVDVLESQLRPRADEAFRIGDYRLAAELYERIRPRLSPTDLKKLAVAKERSQP
jgi:hypothetical protein